MKISDLVTGLILIGLGLGVFGYGLTLPAMPGQRYGAGLFPVMLGVCFMGFGAVLGHRGLSERRGRGAPLVVLADWARNGRLIGNMALVLLLIVAYVAFAQRLGFVPLSLGILIVLFWRFEVPLLKGIVVAVLTTAFIQMAFSQVLRVPLPRGVLDRVLW